MLRLLNLLAIAATFSSHAERKFLDKTIEFLGGKIPIEVTQDGGLDFLEVRPHGGGEEDKGDKGKDS